jgi:hypothetical protein
VKILVTAAQITRPGPDGVVYVNNGETVDVDDKEGTKLVQLGVAVDTATQSVPVEAPKPVPAPKAPEAPSAS